MADNYLERKMEDLRSGRLSSGRGGATSAPYQREPEDALKRHGITSARITIGNPVSVPTAVRTLLFLSAPENSEFGGRVNLDFEG